MLPKCVGWLHLHPVNFFLHHLDLILHLPYGWPRLLHQLDLLFPQADLSPVGRAHKRKRVTALHCVIRSTYKQSLRLTPPRSGRLEVSLFPLGTSEDSSASPPPPFLAPEAHTYTHTLHSIRIWMCHRKTHPCRLLRKKVLNPVHHWNRGDFVCLFPSKDATNEK